LLILAAATGVLLPAIWYGDRLRYVFLLVLKEQIVQVQRGKVTAAFLEEVQRVCREQGGLRGWIGAVPQGGRLRLVFSRSVPPACQQQLRNIWGLIGWGTGRRPASQGGKAHG
jgi:hypothetical protein